LFLSPLLAGLVMMVVGSHLRSTGEEVSPLEGFWGGFAFAFGVALIRFLNVHPIF
jgi:hypothetical protein